MDIDNSGATEVQKSVKKKGGDSIRFFFGAGAEEIPNTKREKVDYQFRRIGQFFLPNPWDSFKYYVNNSLCKG